MSWLEALEDACSLYVIPTVCAFGMVCNTLNIVVLTRPRMTESPYTYLLGLAAADFALLMLCFIHYAISTRIGSGTYFWMVFDAYIFLPVANMMSNAAVWTTVLLTSERFVSVRWPLRAKEICTKSLARRMTVGVFILAGLINIPRFFCKQVTLNGASYAVNSTEFQESRAYQTITWLYITLIHAIPLIVISILNTRLLHAFYQAQRERHALQASSRTSENNNKTKRSIHGSREQWRITVTCITIIFLFLVCIVPSAISNLPVAKLFFGHGRNLSEFSTSQFYRVLRAITNLLVMVNSSLNFVIYCVFNYKFVQTLRHVVRGVIYKCCGAEWLASMNFRRLSSKSSSAHHQAAIVGTPPLGRASWSVISARHAVSEVAINKNSIAFVVLKPIHSNTSLIHSV